MASFTAGTTFVDGVSNDVTAAKLGALVTNATPTSGFIQDRTAETITATNDTLLIGDASDSNNLKRITVANFAQTLPTAKVTTGTIDTGTFGTTTSTAATITALTAGTTTSTNEVVTNGTITNLSATTSTFLGTITGSTNVVNIGSGQIYKDASGNVGIGTTSPLSKLTVVNPSTSTADTVELRGYRNFTTATYGATAILAVSDQTRSTHDFGAIRFEQNPATADGGGALVRMYAGGASSSFASNAEFLRCTSITNNNGADNIQFRTAGTERLRIDVNGNVGIGTTSPDSVLSVYANNKTTPAISARYSAAGIKAGLSVYNSLGFPYLSFNANPVSGSDNATYDISAAASKIDFATSSGSANIVFSNAASGTAGSTISWSERLRIDVNGNVGIGTTSPAAKIHVQGAGTTSGSYTNGDAVGQALYLQDTGNLEGNGGQILFGASQGIFAGIKSSIVSGTGPAGNLIFQTRDTSGNVLDRMVVNREGKVGIGTASPANKLEVVGSFGRGAPVTKTADFTLADTENWLIVNKGSSCTVTLPAASSWTGREFTIKVITAHTVVSASSNIIPRIGGSAATAILPATDGAWATLVSNGTNWEIMCGS